MEWRVWLTFVLLFTAVVSLLLIKSNGLPYGLDNNESFSNITHARAIANFGISRSIGLTDETAATHEGASPYIHSHQGNFPRIFATVIYVLGARSIEAQIIVTTFTIGLSAFWLAYVYLLRRTNVAFAVVACLVMLTDYMLILQWHINTYRVWHAWFFFAILWYIDRSTAPRSRWWTVTGVLLFAALFYWEYVFSFFVGVMAAVYAAIVHRRSIATVAKLWAIEIGGGLLAVAVLLGQLTTYMGWSNVLLDVRYTLEARNSAESQSLRELITAFYDKHHILFWPNYVDASPLRTWTRLSSSVLNDHLKFYTPLVSLLMLIVGGAWLIRLLARFKSGQPQNKAQGPRGIPADTVTSLLVTRTPFPWFRTGLFCLLLWPIYRSSLAIHGAPDFFTRLWENATGLGQWPSVILIAAAVFVAARFALARGIGNRKPNAGDVAGIMPLFVAAIVAYIPTYWVFTGYVFSGYIYRQAPLVSFATDILLALTLYLPAAMAVDTWRNRKIALPGRPGWIRPTTSIVTAALAILVTGSLGYGWIQIQKRYVRLAPPDSHTYFQDLAQPPYAGHSFVVNTYASPVSIQTKSWAMMEPVLFTGSLRLTPRGYEVPRENTYKWFADRETNPTYLKPAYALVQRPGGWSAEMEVDESGPPNAQMANGGLYLRAEQPFTSFLHPRVVRDDHGATQSFAIIKLDWDYPPYLRALPEVDATEESPVEVGTSGESDWRIRIEVPRLGPGQTVSLRRVIAAGIPLDLPALAAPAQGWTADLATGGLVAGGASAVLHLQAFGKPLEIEFEEGPHGGDAVLRINDATADLNLNAPSKGTVSYQLEDPESIDPFVTAPRFLGGQHVLAHVDDNLVTLTYHYAHQDRLPESGTRIASYQQDSDGLWQFVTEYQFLEDVKLLFDEREFRRHNPDAIVEYEHRLAVGDARTFAQWLSGHLADTPAERSRIGLQPLRLAPSSERTGATNLKIELSRKSSGFFRFGISPGDGRKHATEYFSNPVCLAEPESDYGAFKLRLKLTMPAGPLRQPLVVTGSSRSGSLVYLIRESETSVRLGIDAGNRGALLTPPFEVDPAIEQSVEVSLGSLFPLPGHPKLKELPPETRAALRRYVRVVWNGNTVMEVGMPLPPINYRAVKIGVNAGFVDTAPTFAGELLEFDRHWPAEVGRTQHPEGSAPQLFGPIRFRLKFPAGHNGNADPLVSSGVPGAGNFIYVRYVDDTHVRFGYDHWGVAGFLGDPILIERDHWYNFSATMGSLYPAEGDYWFRSLTAAQAHLAKSRVVVHLDDRVVLDATSAAHESSPGFVRVGENQIGGSTTGPVFTGSIEEPKRIPLDTFEFPPAKP